MAGRGATQESRAGLKSSPVAVLDRDGTINVERHYLSEPDQIELLPGAAEGLGLLQRMGFRLLIATNQSAVGRGYITLERLSAIHERLSDVLARYGVRLDGIFFCPHVPWDGCGCRKPRQGMIEKAAAEFGFSPSEAYIVGDKADDIGLGRNAGATTVLVRTGYGREVEAKGGAGADYVTDDLLSAARLIVGLDSSKHVSGVGQL